MGDQYDDDDDTYIKSKRHSSEFSLNFGQYTGTITHSVNCLAEIPINDDYDVFGVFLKIMKSQMDPRIYFCNYYYVNQTCFPDDSQFPRIYLGASILPNDDYSSDEEKYEKSLYMEQQAELENVKPQPNGVDALHTAFLNEK